MKSFIRIKNADLFIFSSKTETQGLVLIEAMASGLPVVVVKDIAFKNVVEDNVNGMVSDKDVKEFSEKVLLLLRNKNMRKKMGDSAKLSVKKFAIQKTVEDLENLYVSLINNNNHKKAKRISVRFYRTLNNLLNT